MKQNKFSMAKFVRSVGYAGCGLRHLLTSEQNAQIHLALSCATTLIAATLGISLADWRWIMVCVSMVWFAEAINTAIEQLCDLIEPNPNEAVRIIKDVAAGAVLCTAAGAAAIGIATFWPYIT
jgi:diacylglycerol kinase (ATP)